jgi:hypothetical protein
MPASEVRPAGAAPAGVHFAELLACLGLARHEESLAGQHIISAHDLRLLNRDDCKELGLSVGERNRLMAWGAQAEPMSGHPMRALVRCVADLERDVVERQAFEQHWDHRRQEVAATGRRGGAPMRIRTRVGPSRVQQAKAKQDTRKRKRKRAKPQVRAAVAVLANALFANAGSARRIGFAIDISGSMGADTPIGVNR